MMLIFRKLPVKRVFLHFSCLLFLLARKTATGQDEPKILPAVERRGCSGTTNDRFPFRPQKLSNRTVHLQYLRTRYTNCTHVEGNLELADIPLEADLGFLEHIREVTGYLLIANVKAPVLNLPNLRIIRGQQLFKYDFLYVHASAGNQIPYSVLIMDNTGLEELGLGRLREITSGPAFVSGNKHLCHLRNTVNWDDLLEENGAHLRPARNGSDLGCSHCSNCSSGYCWGPGREQCQKLTKIICAKQCGMNRCYGPDPFDCCHPQCAAGCTGPGANQCTACRHLDNDGECVEVCPALEKYDSDKKLNVPNPDGTMAYGTLCVKECPQNFLRHQQYCIAKCQPDQQERDGVCVACDGPCPKTCTGFDNDQISWITNGTLERFQNCTIVEGNLVILSKSFTSDSEYVTKGSKRPHSTVRDKNGVALEFILHYGIAPSQLEQLSTIRKITGYLRIEVGNEATNLTDLTFLRNLETIEGRMLWDSRFALQIVGNRYLRTLGLNSLTTIKAGGIGILDNPLLCYADQIAWKSILSQSSTVATTDVTSELLVNNNREKEECVRSGETCYSECTSDGCWGPQQNQCLSCANYKYKSFCLNDCANWNVSKSDLLYHAGNNTCAPCHAQCRDGCTGPTQAHCTACLNVKDGADCVTVCPMDKYSDSRKVCQPCDKSCRGGCTGPGSHVGETGCRSCEVGVVNEGAINMTHCLPVEASCPSRYFQTIAYNETAALATMIGKKICKPCHPYCLKCRDSEVYNCQECTYFRVDMKCELTCPNSTHYVENGTALCQPCNADCSIRGCTGPQSTQCVSCRSYRDYYDPDRPSWFNCTAQCPAERIYSTKQLSDLQIVLDTSESLCSKDDPDSAAKTKHIIIGVVVSVVGVILIVAIVVCFRIKRSKIRLEALIIQDKFAGIELAEPLEPTDNKPNTSKLRLISEQELRRGEQLGQGAFGIVYKGFWTPPNENLKIPVAIKVLKEGVGASATKEILEEAHVMASVNNPHLVSLLALCMTSQIMLVTQLMPLGSLLDYVTKNKKSITSRTLLNWSSQIAKGMKYLEKRHMIHRDLAARNVLVERPNWVKVTDFGLARMLDCHQESVKNTGGLVPIKWLAPECIDRGVYSHKTDVWAFGITVWELLSYGQKPFEKTPVKELYNVLQSGERLPQPSICTLDVYMLLLKCWGSDPQSRPSFVDLAEDFGKMTRDPGRYLVIPGDEFLRLPDYTADDHQRLFGDMEDDGSEKLILAEDYFSPQADGFRSQLSSDSVQKDPPTGPPVPRYTPDPVALKGNHTRILNHPPESLPILGLEATGEFSGTTYLDLGESPKELHSPIEKNHVLKPFFGKPFRKTQNTDVSMADEDTKMPRSNHVDA